MVRGREVARARMRRGAGNGETWEKGERRREGMRGGWERKADWRGRPRRGVECEVMQRFTRVAPKVQEFGGAHPPK